MKHIIKNIFLSLAFLIFFTASLFGEVSKEQSTMGKEIIRNKDKAIQIISSNPFFASNFEKFSDELKNDKDIIIAAITKNGRVLEYLPKFQNNPNVVLEAIKSDPMAFKFASKDLKDNKDFFLNASKCGAPLGYASDRLKDDNDVVLAAVKVSGDAIYYASDRVKKNKAVVLAAVNQNGFALRYTPFFKDDADVVLNSVKSDGGALIFASTRFQDDYDIVLAAVKNYGGALKYASDRLKDDVDIVLAAVKDEPSAMNYASDRLKNDDTLIKTIGISKDTLLQKNLSQLKYQDHINGLFIYSNYSSTGFGFTESFYKELSNKDLKNFKFLILAPINNKFIIEEYYYSLNLSDTNGILFGKKLLPFGKVNQFNYFKQEFPSRPKSLSTILNAPFGLAGTGIQFFQKINFNSLLSSQLELGVWNPAPITHKSSDSNSLNLSMNKAEFISARASNSFSNFFGIYDLEFGASYLSDKLSSNANQKELMNVDITLISALNTPSAIKLHTEYFLSNHFLDSSVIQKKSGTYISAIFQSIKIPSYFNTSKKRITSYGIRYGILHDDRLSAFLDDELSLLYSIKGKSKMYTSEVVKMKGKNTYFFKIPSSKENTDYELSFQINYNKSSDLTYTFSASGWLYTYDIGMGMLLVFPIILTSMGTTVLSYF